MNSNFHKVSIIIPVKNEEKRILKCLNAIKRLDFDDKLIEVIIVDNGSSDSTTTIAKNYACRVYVKPSLTISGLRNFGVTHANGDVLCFVDADVIVNPSWLKTALPHFANPQNACVTGLINIPSNHTWVEKTWSLNRKTKKEVFMAQWASSMNMIIRKDLFLKVKGFSETLITGEDVDLSNRLIENGFQIVFDKKVSVVHIGEAKTLKEFIRKERWRGFSDLDLLLSKDFKLSNLKNACQPLFFIFSWIFLLFSSVYCNYFLIRISVLLIVLLPIMRTIIVSRKQGTLKYIFPLFLIWFVYYFSRSIAIVDNVKNSIKWS